MINWLKSQNKSTLILLSLLLLGVVVIILMFSGAFDTEAAPRDFATGEFSITLTEEFREDSHEDYYAVYLSPSAWVCAAREEVSPTEPLTLKEYAQKLRDTNTDAGLEMQEHGDFVFFEFIAQSNQQNVYMLIACYKSQDAYWAVNMVTPEGNKEYYRSIFLNWAESVKIG